MKWQIAFKGCETGYDTYNTNLGKHSEMKRLQKEKEAECESAEGNFLLCKVCMLYPVQMLGLCFPDEM